eukprot:TRINITY_DN825_c0_g1_i1.p1 TRINITY_DN825_c0_g1~~TRINITY_DN825_c0_g1_i1.p1  ORF type:complete len:302 (+),score=73.02 TRINITY_DN825_c0_g1_i1:26-907(+)
MEKFLNSNGIQLCYEQFDGTQSGFHLLFCHCTGFSKEMWHPLVSDLRSAGMNYPITLMDMRGHGNSILPGPPFKLDWHDFGTDVLNLAKILKNDQNQLVGVGLSKGGAAITIAEIMEPNTFAGIVLMEPIIFAPESPNYGKVEDTPLSQMVEKRRSNFPSMKEAIDYFEKKPMTSTWDKRFVDAYTKGILREKEDKTFELKCNPLMEAQVYRTGAAHKTWDRLGEIKIPVSLLSGEISKEFPNLSVRMTNEFKNAKMVESAVIKGAGHFIPMDKPQRTVESVLKMLNSLKCRL